MTGSVPEKVRTGFGLSFVAAMLATICTVVALDEIRLNAQGISTFDALNTAGAGAFVAVLALAYFMRLAFAKRATRVMRLYVIRTVQIILALTVAAAALATVLVVATRFATGEATGFVIAADMLHLGTLVWLGHYSPAAINAD